MAQTIAGIRESIEDQMDRLTELRHDLHQHPELMFAEHRTSKIVQQELDEIGVEYVAGLAKGTGVLAHLPATVDEPLPTVALRADMDALPIQEAEGQPYRSTCDGVMHACGHDGHTTILLGAARLLAQLEHRPRPVTLLFQPAEEGGGGGRFMVEEGALNGTRLGQPVSQIYGLHGWPNIPRGTLATKSGPLLAATDEFRVLIRGHGSHAAFPHLGHDPILAASHIVTAVQSLAARHTDPTDSLVLSITTFHGGDAFNVIPGDVTLTGTMRTLEAETRRSARAQFLNLVESTAHALGCAADVEWMEGYPVTRNHPQAVERFFDVAHEAVGEGSCHVVEKPVMGGEDFSYYCEVVPACFFLLGLLEAGRDPATVAQLHQPNFDFNDRAMPLGIEMFARLVLGD